ncbi:hypothetical protein G7Y89_g8372 [Cudoniella acicularis]|uniref:Uncharacterized protein n=1 Tax=Cudoniella acicularis TaxID=354080 RepID=A0A8H4RGR3_9HELO|nr:hypothetical protein G7Y89_g8372 [Cudoniella acicularis]
MRDAMIPQAPFPNVNTCGSITAWIPTFIPSSAFPHRDRLRLAYLWLEEISASFRFLIGNPHPIPTPMAPLPRSPRRTNQHLERPKRFDVLSQPQRATNEAQSSAVTSNPSSYLLASQRSNLHLSPVKLILCIMQQILNLPDLVRRGLDLSFEECCGTEAGDEGVFEGLGGRGDFCGGGVVVYSLEASSRFW